MGISNPSFDKTVALIAGPTASGKTALALHLAKMHPSVIINADSAQVYSPLPLLSASPSKEEMATAPHRLFAYLDGSTPCSAADWARDAKEEITKAHAENRLPILVGGTGLYMQILLEGVAPIPNVEPEIRDQARTMDLTDAQLKLQEYDPEMAAKLNANDSARIRRALEVILSSGKSIAYWRQQKVGGIGDNINLRPMILTPPRDWLYERCNRRFELMIDGGAIDEVKALLQRGYPSSAPVMRAIGVPEITAMLTGEITQAEAIEKAQTATRRYAKRQYTWFSNQPPDNWPRINEVVNYNNIDKIVTLFQ